MGGSESKPEPPPVQRVVFRPSPDPPNARGLTNISVTGGTNACRDCTLSIETGVTNSSVKLSRDFGNFSDAECLQYQRDLLKVGKEISFQDFFTRLQAGGYSRPTFERPAGDPQGAAQFCEQIFFDEETAAAVTDFKTFKEKEKDLMSVRIRQVNGAGNFSSDTKAKYTLSLPVKMSYTAGLRQTPGVPRTQMRQVRGRWVTTQVMGPPGFIPDIKSTQVKTLTLYHPCPVRIENVQYDAVLSLNDPADSDADVIVLVPLKGSNFGSDSESFFGKIVKQLAQISTPDSVTGLFPTADIATGNQWNIEQIFSLKTTPADTKDPEKGVRKDIPSPVANAYFTWMAAPTYKRKKVSESPTELVYAWEPDGREVRYFMLQYPVSISLTDLSILTRNMPTTDPKRAIHTIPESPKLLYKRSEPPALSKECGSGTVRETMQNPSDALGSLFSSEDLSSVLKGADGSSLADTTNTCDPFAMNAQKARGFKITPSDAARFFFNFLVLIALALGTWAAFYSVLQNYDMKFTDFASDAGKVIGTLALQTSGRMQTAFYRGNADSGKGVEDAPGVAPSVKNMAAEAGKMIGLKTQ